MIRTTVIGSQPEFETGILRTGLDEYECTRPGLDVAGIKEELAEQRKLNMEHQLATRLDILAEGEVGRVDRDAMGHAYVTYIGRFMSGLSPLYHKSLNDEPTFLQKPRAPASLNTIEFLASVPSPSPLSSMC